MTQSWIAVGLFAVLVGAAPRAAAEPPATPGVDSARIAETIINRCAGLRQGEAVLINGSMRDQELLECLAVEARKIGAQPMLTFESDRLVRRMYTDVPPQFDTQRPEFELKLAEIINAEITIDVFERPDLLADIAPQRLLDRRKAFEPVDKRMLERGVVAVNLGNGLYPTKALASQFGVGFEDLTRIFWGGVNTNYAALQATGEKVKARLAEGSTVRIAAPNGTDLTFQITRRPVFVSDGVVSQDDRYARGPACQVWLPAGEVYVTPVAGTASGTFVADNFFHQGKLIEGLTLKFASGRLTSMTARGDMSSVRRLYDAAPEGKDLFAALDIGINPDVKAPQGSRMVTWMSAGMISVGIGGNTWAGGDNSAPYDLFAHLPGGTLTVDGKAIVEHGRLVVN